MGRTFLEAVRAKYVDTSEDVAAADDLVVAAEGQAETKRWEMVGMDKLKRRTAQLGRLRSAAVGEEGVTSAGDAAELRAALPLLEAVDLSLAAPEDFRGWELPCSLAEALPSLRSLDLSCAALWGDAAAPPLPGSLARIETLVLNKTRAEWGAVCAVGDTASFAALRELYLEGNALSSVGAEPLEAPQLRRLSLLDNKLGSWDPVAAVLRQKIAGKNALAELVVSDNPLPAPPLELAELAREAGLEALSMAGAAAGPSLAFFRELGKAEGLRSLKVTYPALPKVPPNHVRLLVLAEMPCLATLNTSAVSPKERAEAEKFYVLHAFSKLPQGTSHKDDCSDLPEGFLADHPSYAAFVAKHSNPSAAAAAAPQGGMAGIAELTLRDCLEGKRFKPDVTRPIPVCVKVAQLKAVVKAAFGVDTAGQCLVYKSLEHEIPVPTPLDNDLEPLSYYGITGGRGVVEVSAK